MEVPQCREASYFENKDLPNSLALALNSIDQEYNEQLYLVDQECLQRYADDENGSKGLFEELKDDKDFIKESLKIADCLINKEEAAFDKIRFSRKCREESRLAYQNYKNQTAGENIETSDIIQSDSGFRDNEQRSNFTGSIEDSMENDTLEESFEIEPIVHTTNSINKYANLKSHHKKFTLDNPQIDEVVKFLEIVFIHNTIRQEMYMAMDNYQKTLVDATFELVLTNGVHANSPGIGPLKDADFKPKRKDDQGKIILSLILKSIVRKYKEKLKIKDFLRKRNIYLAIYYHFAYNGEDYKDIYLQENPAARYREAESAFLTHTGVNSRYLKGLCPEFIEEIIKFCNNQELLEHNYKIKITNSLHSLFKMFDKRQMAEVPDDDKSEDNKIDKACYYTILSRLSAKSRKNIKACKLPVPLRFIRKYAEDTKRQLLAFKAKLSTIKRSSYFTSV